MTYIIELDDELFGFVAAAIDAKQRAEGLNATVSAYRLIQIFNAANAEVKQQKDPNG